MTIKDAEAAAGGGTALDLLRAVRAAAESGSVPARGALPRVATDATMPNGAVWPELCRLVAAPYPAEGIDLLYDTGLADLLLPEISALRTMPAGGRHKDVYLHTIRVVEQCEPEPVLRMAALLHDIGKPSTKLVEHGAVSFPQHAEVGAAMARRRLRRLGAEPEAAAAIVLLVALHVRANSYEDDWTDSAVRRLDREAGDQLERLLALSRADVTSGRREAVERALRRVDRLEARIAAVRRIDIKPECPLTGHDLMALFARPPGRWIGAVKGELEAAVARGDLAADDIEGATALARRLVDMVRADGG